MSTAFVWCGPRRVSARIVADHEQRRPVLEILVAETNGAHGLRELASVRVPAPQVVDIVGMLQSVLGELRAKAGSR